MRHHMATLTPRSDFSLGSPPVEGYVPTACCVGPNDGWDLAWCHPDPGVEADFGTHIIEWPFGPDDVADNDDFRALGFVVE